MKPLVQPGSYGLAGGIAAAIHVACLLFCYLVKTTIGRGTVPLPKVNHLSYAIRVVSQASQSRQQPPKALYAHRILPGQQTGLKPIRPISKHQRAPHSSTLTGSAIHEGSSTQKEHKIDQRGLYHIKKIAKKQAGAILELDGWKWDHMPKPDDPSEECGKLLFEIKVDSQGEVIAIRTIEKTVSPMIEQIYIAALRRLTFSRVLNTQPQQEISTGKVTFLLVPK